MEHLLALIVFAVTYLCVFTWGMTTLGVVLTSPVWAPLYVWHRHNRGRHYA